MNLPREKCKREPLGLPFPDLTGFNLSDFSAFLHRVDPEWLAMNSRLPPDSVRTQDVQSGTDAKKDSGSHP